MESKNKRAYDPGSLAPSQRLKRNLGDLFSRNELPATRIGELANDINRAAPTQLRSLTGPVGKHSSKKMRRQFMKRSTWMPDYIAEIRTWNPKTQRIVREKVSMQLAHEIIAVLLKNGFKEKMMNRDQLDPLSLQHLLECEELSGEDLLGLGIWGDGAPTQWDRNETIDVISLSFPGIDGYQNLRIPLIILPHSRVCSETWEDFFAILKWSLTVLATGHWPTCRHDGSDWNETDKCRKTARPFLKAALVEVRQDWKFAVEVFGFPAHNTVEGCCWACKCTPPEVQGWHPQKTHPSDPQNNPIVFERSSAPKEATQAT